MLFAFFLLYSEPFYSCSLGPLRGSQWPLFARVAETDKGEMAGVISDGQQSLFHFFSPTGALLFQKNLPGRGYVDYLLDEQGGSIFLALVSEPDNAETDSETPDADLFFFNTQGSLLYQMHLVLQTFIPSKDHRAFALVNKSRLNAHQDRADYELYRAANGKKYRSMKRQKVPDGPLEDFYLEAPFLFLDPDHALRAVHQTVIMESPHAADRWSYPHFDTSHPDRSIDQLLYLGENHLGVLFHRYEDLPEWLVLFDIRTGERKGDLQVSDGDPVLYPMGWQDAAFSKLNLASARKMGGDLIFNEWGPTMVTLSKLNWTAISSGQDDLNGLFEHAIYSLQEIPPTKPKRATVLAYVPGKWGIIQSGDNLSYHTF